MGQARGGALCRSAFSLWAAPGGLASGQLEAQGADFVLKIKNDFKPLVCVESEALSPGWLKSREGPLGSQVAR